jgi:hypothetical protein
MVDIESICQGLKCVRPPWLSFSRDGSFRASSTARRLTAVDAHSKVDMMYEALFDPS